MAAAARPCSSRCCRPHDVTDVSAERRRTARVDQPAVPYGESMTSLTAPRRRHLALLGGFRYRGESPAPEKLLCIAVVGGADLDFTREPLRSLTTITKVSLVGGVKLRVPADATVEVTGFNVVGRRGPFPPVVPAERPGPVIRLRSYGIWGGVSVQRG